MPAYFSTADFVGSLAGSVRDVFTRPTEFFRQMPAATSYKDASILLVVVMVLPMMLILLLRSGSALPPMPELASIPQFVVMIVFLIFAIPLILAMTWLWAWYLGWAVRRLADGNLSTMDAFQLFAYSYIPNLFGWVPVLGLFMGIWSIYLEWKGLTTYADVSGGKALLIIFLPMLVVTISGIVLAILIPVYVSHQQPPPIEHMF